MGRVVAVEEWAEIHGKTPATVRSKIHANAWPNAQKILLDGKQVWMLDEDWLWPRAMTPTKQAKLLCEIRRLMPPVVYTTAEDGTVICMVPCTHHTHVASGVTADEMNDLWRAAPPQRAAAQAALQYGWLHPLADPRSYNERGERLHNAYNRKKYCEKHRPQKAHSERAGAPGGAGGTVSPVCPQTPPDSPAGGAGGYLRV